MIGLITWFVLRRKRTSAGQDYAAAPSVEGSGEMGRYSGYGMGGGGVGGMGMTGGGYAGGYRDERSPSNEDGIPMKYYVRFSLFLLSLLSSSCSSSCALPNCLSQDPSDPSTYPGMTTPTSPGPGPSIHTTNNTINTTSNTGSSRPFSQNISHYNGLPEV